VPEPPRNLAPKREKTGQAAHGRVFQRAEADFRPAMRRLPRLLPRLSSPRHRFPPAPLDRNDYKKKLATGKEDLRSRVRPYREERKAREEAEKAAAEESKRRLQAIEDSLLLTGHI
jgi:hypothetical protein